MRHRFKVRASDDVIVEWEEPTTGIVMAQTWVRCPGLVPVEGKSEKPRGEPGWCELADVWNEVAKRITGRNQVVRPLSPARLTTAKARLKEEPDLAVWKRAFEAICKDPFLAERGYATFDYATRPQKSGKWLDVARSPEAVAPRPTAGDGGRVCKVCGKGSMNEVCYWCRSKEGERHVQEDDSTSVRGAEGA